MSGPGRGHVLLLAYVCTRDAGSEPEIGYTTVLAAARAGYRVTVLTMQRDAARLRVDLIDDGADLVTVVGVDGSARIERHVGRLGMGHIHYMLWQARALRVARSLEATVDVVHHVTFGADWMPAAALLLGGVPVVWGPVGGFARPPWMALPYLTGRGIAQEFARELITRPMRRLTLRAVRRNSALVVAHNEDTAGWYRRRGCPAIAAPLVAMPPVEQNGSQPVHAVAGGRRTIVFIGRLTPWKGCLLAVRTLARLGEPWHLDLYGRGAAQDRIEALAHHLGVADRVHLRGHVPKDEIWSALRDADVLLLPSLHDSAPQPVAQALRSGCPVVCLDSAGPPLLAGDRGQAVPIRRRLPDELAAAVRRAKRFPPDDRWSSARLPAILDGIYQRVLLPGATRGSR